MLHTVRLGGNLWAWKIEMVNHPNRSKEVAVLVTTAHKGVFFGYTNDYSGKSIDLRAARNCVYWPTEQKGFLGLASDGPVKGSRIGPAADLLLHDITSVAKVTEAAEKAWLSAPWSR